MSHLHKRGVELGLIKPAKRARAVVKPKGLTEEGRQRIREAQERRWAKWRKEQKKARS